MMSDAATSARPPAAYRGLAFAFCARCSCWLVHATFGLRKLDLAACAYQACVDAVTAAVAAPSAAAAAAPATTVKELPCGGGDGGEPNARSGSAHHQRLAPVLPVARVLTLA